jgi:hypothetical protein
MGSTKAAKVGCGRVNLKVIHKTGFRIHDVRIIFSGRTHICAPVSQMILQWAAIICSLTLDSDVNAATYHFRMINSKARMLKLWFQDKDALWKTVAAILWVAVSTIPSRSVFLCEGTPII